MSTPLVSIIMCTYNRARYLPEAIQSVLDQEFKDWELIILDDTSIDNTEEVVKSYSSADSRIKYIKNDTNLGIAKNRNKGLAEALGKYIAVLDSDDLWSLGDKLSQQVSFLESHPDYGIIGTFVTMISENGSTIKNINYETESSQIVSKMLLRNQIAHSSALFKKDLALASGGYDENILIWEDYDLWLKMGKTHKIKNLALYSTKYRVHKNNSDKSNKIRGARTHLDIIKKYGNDYSNYIPALIKAYVRILKSFFTI